VWFLSGARCRLLAYGPADATASRIPIISLPFWYRLTQVVLEKRPLNGCNVVQLLLCEYSMPSMMAISPLPVGGFIPPTNACMLPWAPRVDIANSILIGSAALAELVVMTYRQTKLDAGRTAKPDVHPPSYTTSRLCQQQQKLVGRRFLRHRETNFRLIIHSHSSTNPENFAKMDPVDFAIIGLTGIGKNN